MKVALVPLKRLNLGDLGFSSGVWHQDIHQLGMQGVWRPDHFGLRAGMRLQGFPECDKATVVTHLSVVFGAITDV